MHFSTQVNFSRRFGKTIGNNVRIKNMNESLEEKFKNQINNDILLCVWLYYEDYERFIKEFSEYFDNLNDDYIKNLGTKSNVYLGDILKLFWLESNDQSLREKYNQEVALDNYKVRVEKNGYKFNDKDKDSDGFYLTLRLLEYINNNKELCDELFKLTRELYDARVDDIIHCRTKDEWEILYSLRYLYKNLIENDKYNFNKKQKLEHYLMFYQDSTEGLNWHNPYSTKLIESIEYFPRETSKPPYDYAYSSYYNLKETAQDVVDTLIVNSKKQQKETSEYFTNKIKTIKDYYERRERMIKMIKYGFRSIIIIGLSIFVYKFIY